MLHFIVENRWTLLIGAEIVFWLTTISFLVLRYGLGLHKLSKVLLGVTLLNECWIIVLGLLDYMETGKFSTYQVIIVAFIIYAFTYGKKDAQRLDRFVQRKIAEWRGEPVPAHLCKEKEKNKLYGWAHTKKELKALLIHLLVFTAAHIIFVLTFGLSVPVADLLEKAPSQWGSQPLFQSALVSKISMVWSLIFVIDVVISFSYVIFPKNK
ncbi:hypothetical protein ACFO25_13145 [Paenactinomyces guangxiensis]|uniref:Integral membrane protein n=1 Tax=Paenactinomyces guangxiensis TaxID=1490290 RepID=A0A7W1WP32_9BACL|nr:hypothetical protein [Paenactinomyces guangxiensis]MBA4493395.1 hypothetical protein [Paenactinomyces guangxiensis]MBH8590485.1 hypothetical protein [Paenactinomyces guangxiensis]